MFEASEFDGSNVRVIKIATANTTYAAQLAELKPFYDALTDLEKKKSRLYYGGYDIFCVAPDFGIYTMVYADSSNHLRVLSASIGSQTFKIANNSLSFTDESNTVYTNSMILKVVD